MKIKTVILTAGMIFFLMNSVSASVNKIVLIGNSITKGIGSSDGTGFRDDLYAIFNNVNYPFEFVGCRGDDELKGHFLAGANISMFYSGLGGNGYFDVKESMNYEPNIAVIHLGTNDVNMSYLLMSPYKTAKGDPDPNTASGRLVSLLIYLCKWKNGEYGDHLHTIFVSQIIPNLDNNEEVLELNAEISRIVSDANKGLIAGISPGTVKLINQYTSFNTETMFKEGDSLHPNDAGYVHMANIFFEAFRTLPMELSYKIEYTSSIPNVFLEEPVEISVLNGFDAGVSDIPITVKRINGDALIIADMPDAMDSLSSVTNDDGSILFNFQVGDEDTSKFSIETRGYFKSYGEIKVIIRDYVTVNGRITYYSDQSPVSDVYVFCQENHITSSSTDKYGYFSIDSLPPSESASFSAYKEQKSGYKKPFILSYDAALVARHAIGLDSLDYFSQLAADVNLDSIVNIEDAAGIARYVVGLDSGSWHTGEWIFDPETAIFNSVNLDLEGVDFTGMVLGDVHGGRGQDSQQWNGEVEIYNRRMSKADVYSKDSVLVSMAVIGDNVYSCNIDIEINTEKVKFLNVATTEASRDFTLNINAQVSNRVMIGMYSSHPFSGSDEFVKIYFAVDNEWGDWYIKFNNIFVNQTYVDYNNSNAILEVNRSEETNLAILGSNYPNPFNSETIIPFSLEHRSNINISIYNMVGQRIKTIINNKIYGPGDHTIKWNGCDKNGVEVSSGIYFIELLTDCLRRVEKLEKID